MINWMINWRKKNDCFEQLREFRGAYETVRDEEIPVLLEKTMTTIESFIACTED